MTSRAVQRNYITLTLLNTLAASFIWGINTLFLLDAGLSNAEAFAANAFFTAGMVLFEIPTGIVADTLGRKVSFLMGTFTLLFSTLIYYYLWQHHIGFWPWALVSVLLGLGFTFFSGAVEAWLVDALGYTGFKGALEDVFAKGQIASGAAMLFGATMGGYIAQRTNLGVPYIFRCGFLILSFVFAFWTMKDLGFKPRKLGNIPKEIKAILKKSLEVGFHKKHVRWMILASPFVSGTGVYAFYAAQPFLLELYGETSAYLIAGIAASLVAGSQILGGLMVPSIRKKFKKRTTAILLLMGLSAVVLMAIGLADQFWWVLGLLALWGLIGAAAHPIRQAYLNKCLPSQQRATLLSFDGLVGSTGGVVFQPLLGRSADLWGYGFSFLLSGLVQIAALPFIVLARRENSTADQIES